MRRLAAVAGLVLGCGSDRDEAPPGVLTVVQEQQASWVRNFNPLVVSGSARWPSACGIHEPMMIFNRMTGVWTPWLATGYAWEDDERTLRFTTRDGVKWSDGAPFSAADVVFTLRLLRDHPALDTSGVWRRVVDVEAPDASTVVVRFGEPYVPGLAHIAHLPIVPAHVWGAVADPVTFTNPEPVGTGPFTEVRVFRNQVWELGRNPHYWQEGRPAVEALRFPAMPSNDQANLALIRDEIDWAGNFVPAIDRIYVGEDPEHHHYWFPPIGSMIFLYPNTTRAQLDDARVRKALSMAVDRALVVKVGLYDYAEPADGSGLSDVFAGWRDRAPGADADWVRHDVARAAALLDEAGLRLGPDGVRRRADGSPLTLSVIVPAGWSDWVRSAQVVVANLRSVGVDAKLQALDFSAWMERLTRGDFDLSLGWSSEGVTPHVVYQGLMSAAAARPVGEVAATNWHRFADPAVDELLDAFERTSDPDEQRRLVHAMQARFVREAPAIPLFPAPSWGEYSTSRFTGFPSADDPYAGLSPNLSPDPLLVLTRLVPVTERQLTQAD
jgi:peptide/nickel transport system substrate-binding protein